jgi:Leucine-rich repeat (LRR) protein
VNSALLWNIGVLIDELYFGELPFEKNDNKKIIKLKKSNNVEFDDLIENLLLDEDKRIKWKEYLNHKFIINIKPEEVFKIILDKNLQKSDKEIDLCENNIDDNIASILLKMKFDNLMILNLSNNVIENIEIDNNNKEIFRNVKFMNLENNKLKALSVDVLNKLSKLEYLFLSNNNLNNLETFQEMNLSNLNYLSLAQNKLVNISHLSKVNLNNLNILNLSFNNIENISCLQKMNIPYLEELKLANNNIYNIDCLENINLPKLKSLDLKHNKIKSIEVLENVNFPDLEILNLDNNDISDINSLKNLSFNETLKELNLKNNQIKEFSLLNNIYFPSLTKVNLLTFNNNNIDQQLKILSIKLRLYGYKLNSINNGSISILIAPFNITKSEIWENKLFDYTNSFKINANIGANQEEIIYFFLSKVLEMNDYEIIKNKNLIII